MANNDENEAKRYREIGGASVGAIAPRRDVCTGISGAQQRMVHLREGGLNHPLSRWHFRGWGADFIVFRTSLYTRVRHFFFFPLYPLLFDDYRRADKGR